MFLPIRKPTQLIYSYNQLYTSMSTMINHQKVYSSNIPYMFYDNSPRTNSFSVRTVLYEQFRTNRNVRTLYCVNPCVNWCMQSTCSKGPFLLQTHYQSSSNFQTQNLKLLKCRLGNPFPGYPSPFETCFLVVRVVDSILFRVYVYCNR
jgi:hypothetical protein